MRGFITCRVNKTRRIKLGGGGVAGMYSAWERCEMLVGQPERKTSLRRSRRRWEDNIKMYPKEIGFRG
jgi:hypothetical protein